MRREAPREVILTDGYVRDASFNEGCYHEGCKNRADLGVSVGCGYESEDVFLCRAHFKEMVDAMAKVLDWVAD